MGEMADMFLEEVEEAECRRLDYRNGDISDYEAYDLGIIDENRAEIGRHCSSRASKTCRCCGENGLFWSTYSGEWRLFDMSGIHKCPINPL